MKTFVSLAVVFAVLAHAESFNWHAAKHCKKDGDKKDEKECYSLCTLKAFGSVNDKGEVDYSKFSTEQQPTVKACDKNNKQEHICERAEGLGKCLRKLWPNFKNMTANNDKFSKECAEETKTEAPAKGHKNMFKFDDKKACYHRCMMIKMGWINENNEANTDKIPSWGKKKGNMDEVIKKCAKEHQEEDKCMQAIQRARCGMKAMFPKKKEE